MPAPKKTGGLMAQQRSEPPETPFLQLGREVYYKETFGNEVFLTDILGVTDGPLTFVQMAKAILALKGEGTSNLQVELAKDAVIGGRAFKKGEKIDTGIDVVKGSMVPLGMPVVFREGKPKIGLTCIACHATVDPETKQVIEGVKNTDLNSGLLLAMATNSAAFFTHANTDRLEQYIQDVTRVVPKEDGGQAALPDPKALEDAVDRVLLQWPPGFFDTTIDLVANPTDIPHTFARDAEPYSWSGFAMAGPHQGLSAFGSNVHSFSTDTTSIAEHAKPFLGIDKEVYFGTILQNSANPRYRYDPASGILPSEFFRQVDPTPDAPGILEVFKLPSYPRVSMIGPSGLFSGSPGYRVGEQINASSAWQKTLRVPTRGTILPEAAVQGEQIFRKADCIRCHAGPAYTNHRILPAEELGTEPSRSQAFQRIVTRLDATLFYSEDTPIPVPPGAKVIEAEPRGWSEEEVKLAWGIGGPEGKQGGYKVPSLRALAFTAPYLHDGGAAAGEDVTSQLGLPGTVLKGIKADPANSLRVLLDRNLREKAIAANRRAGLPSSLHMEGVGHEYWVDTEAGYTKEQQDALIEYLLHLPEEGPRAIAE
nr:electron transport protein [Paenibacillus turpanensis]